MKDRFIHPSRPISVNLKAKTRPKMKIENSRWADCIWKERKSQDIDFIATFSRFINDVKNAEDLFCR